MELETNTDRRAPMAAAPMKYRPDGHVDWGNMWDTFCNLAQEGGPPHRGEMLLAPEAPNPYSEAYQSAAREIIRGVKEVSGLSAYHAEPGWIAVACSSQEMARWLADAIWQENVEARARDKDLLVPVSDSFTVKEEIKNVITAVAKTTHYWDEHLGSEVKQALRLLGHFNHWWQRARCYLFRSPTR